ncbi:hypothetical protein [Candidatus Hodarchaeum mangrovi]
MSYDLSKLFENSLVLQIISQLTIKEYSMSEISKILELDDKKLLIALISELYRVGIINLIDKSFNEEESESKPILDLPPLVYNPSQLFNPLSNSLGLPIDKFISLWNTIGTNNEERALNAFDQIFLTIPTPLKKNLKGKGLKELKQYFTNNYL